MAISSTDSVVPDYNFVLTKVIGKKAHVLVFIF